jgi:nitroimidazol reductase NimA-like FMN-containing flavoprotein (pyridoxamine 5'-phosphate oxidase superfamily)
MDSVNARQTLRELLASQRLAVLAASDGEMTHATLVAFSVTEDLGTIVFATTRATRKFRIIGRNPRVSMLIDNRTNEVADFRDALAATAHGTAAETAKEDSELLQLYLSEHPYLRDFVSAPTCALVAVRVDRYDLVGSFQNVLEIRVDD